MNAKEVFNNAIIVYCIPQNELQSHQNDVSTLTFILGKHKFFIDIKKYQELIINTNK